MRYPACQYAVPSLSGTYIASLTPQHLYVQWAHSLAPAYTFPLEGENGTRSIAETSTLQWSARSSHLLLLSTQGITIFALHDTALKIHVANGSGGLGKIAAANFVGDVGAEQVMVVWEFGRVNMWDLSTGKGYEIGEAKLGGIRGNSWAVRRLENKTEVFALLSRTAAQDVLSLYLASSPAPFRSVQLPTVDAQSISWSPCGKWLAVLDTPLASQSLYIYTADGHLFRTYLPDTSCPLPMTSKTSQDQFALGYRAMAWGPNSLALASSQQSITTLDSRTFIPVGTLSHLDNNDSLNDAPTAYEESISASGARSYTFLTGSRIPRSSPKSNMMDLQFNPSGTLLATRDESAPSTLSIWSPERRRLQVQLLQHSTLRKMTWHPFRESLLMVLGDDGSLHLWDLTNSEPPVHVPHAFSSGVTAGKVEARWIASSDALAASSEKLAILVTTKRAGWVVVWPEGRGDVSDERMMPEVQEGEDATEDSLYDILAGRTPLPELSTKKQMEFPEEDENTRLEDTFRDKMPVSIDSDPDIF